MVTSEEPAEFEPEKEAGSKKISDPKRTFLAGVNSRNPVDCACDGKGTFE